MSDHGRNAEVFAQSFRLTARLHRRRPELSKVLLQNGLTLASSDKGLAPRARRDIEAGMRSGRLTVRDPELALTIVTGVTHSHRRRSAAARPDDRASRRAAG